MVEKCFVAGCDGQWKTGACGLFACEDHEDILWQEYGVKAEILYFDNPHPVNADLEIKEFWHQTHSESKIPFQVPNSLLQHFKRVHTCGNDNLEELFARFNSNKNPLSSTEGQRLLKEMDVHHTSMSIGDMVRIGKDYYVVCLVGFRKAEFIKSNLELEKEGKGRCEECQGIEDIGRGENFIYDEEKNRWLCLECADKAGLDEWGYPQVRA